MGGAGVWGGKVRGGDWTGSGEGGGLGLACLYVGLHTSPRSHHQAATAGAAHHSAHTTCLLTGFSQRVSAHLRGDQCKVRLKAVGQEEVSLVQHQHLRTMEVESREVSEQAVVQEVVPSHLFTRGRGQHAYMKH